MKSRDLMRETTDQHGAVSVVKNRIGDGTQQGSLEGSHPSTADDDEIGLFSFRRFADLLPGFLPLQDLEAERNLHTILHAEKNKVRR